MCTLVRILPMVLAAFLAFAQNADVAGKWIWTIGGPQGEKIDIDVTLKVDGSSVSGSFVFEGGRTLQIEKGSIEGRAIKLSIKRDRPQGGTMVYNMNGEVDGDKISGTTSTEIDGNAVTDTFTARRK